MTALRRQLLDQRAKASRYVRLRCIGGAVKFVACRLDRVGLPFEHAKQLAVRLERRQRLVEYRCALLDERAHLRLCTEQARRRLRHAWRRHGLLHIETRVIAALDLGLDHFLDHGDVTR